MENVPISFHKPAFRLTAAAMAMADELAHRIADPQNLEDGMLAVAVDEIIAGMIQQADASALKALGFEPVCSQSASAMQIPPVNSHFSANPADLTASLLSSTDQPRWLRNP